MISDMALKQQLNTLADEKNRIETNHVGRKYLTCGAKLRNREGFCKFAAGRQTTHKGYGRCYIHGGATTGPKSEEGKAVASQNAKKHGLYSRVLNPVEQEIFEELGEQPKRNLENAIRLLETKILSYLYEWRKRYEYYEQTLGVHEAEKRMKVWYTTGENGSKGCYHAGSIEDRPLIRALNELAKMVEKNARLDPEGNEDLLSKVNKELQAASHGKITVAWGDRKAQSTQAT